MFKDKIRWIDIKSSFLFLLAYPIALVRKIRHKDVWLYSERSGEARDNGFWMYKYTKENHPEQEAYYVIKKDSCDREKLLKYGKTIDFGSFSHYVVYLTAKKHISAHIDSDSPNSRVSNFLETHKLLKNKRVFLQHGITKDKISFGYYTVSRSDIFVCAARPEYEFCKQEFGYPEGAVKLLGFARFDGLGVCKPQRRILLMPTWRSWLADIDENEFIKSKYYNVYSDLLNNDILAELLEKNNIDLVFYPHSDMQKFVHLFKRKSDRIIIKTDKQTDVQELLNNSAMLITDYSSVAFDMAYMDRPIIYYQFDYDEYREKQHPEGYYSYQNDGFGPICFDVDQLFSKLKKCVEINFQNDVFYNKRRNTFFSYNDRDNCSRIYRAISEL